MIDSRYYCTVGVLADTLFADVSKDVMVCGALLFFRMRYVRVHDGGEGGRRLDQDMSRAAEGCVCCVRVHGWVL